MKKKSFQIPPQYGDIVVIQDQICIVTRVGSFYFHVFPEWSYSIMPANSLPNEKYFHLSRCTYEKCFCKLEIIRLGDQK